MLTSDLQLYGAPHISTTIFTFAASIRMTYLVPFKNIQNFKYLASFQKIIREYHLPEPNGAHFFTAHAEYGCFVAKILCVHIKSDNYFKNIIYLCQNQDILNADNLWLHIYLGNNTPPPILCHQDGSGILALILFDIK